MEDHTDLDQIGKALCDFLNDMPLLLEVDEVCAILDIKESDLRQIARSDGLDIDEECVMRDDLKNYLMKKGE